MAKKKDNIEGVDDNLSTFDNFKKMVNTTTKENVIYTPATEDGAFRMPRISTGSLSLDVAIGGGVPEGRQIMFYGPESTCKSTISYSTIANVTQLSENNKCFIEDPENSFDIHWVESLGANMNNIQVSRCKHAEQSIDVIELALKSGVFRVVLLDSIAALITKKDLEGSAEDNSMGGLAARLSKAWAKWERAKSECFQNYGFMPTFLVINQLREKIGLMFGDPSILTGGKAQNYYMSIKCKFSKAEPIVENDEIVGGRFPFEITKNKTFPAWKKGTLSLYNCPDRFGKISNEEPLIELCVKAGVFQKAGAWYSYEGSNIAQGLEKTIAVVEAFPDEKKNELLKKAMDIIYPSGIDLAFRFKDDV